MSSPYYVCPSTRISLKVSRTRSSKSTMWTMKICSNTSKHATHSFSQDSTPGEESLCIGEFDPDLSSNSVPCFVPTQGGEAVRTGVVEKREDLSYGLASRALAFHQLQKLR